MMTDAATGRASVSNRWSPWRIFFIEGDGSERPINSQAYNHAWLVWPGRDKRNSNKSTRVEWASQYGKVQSWH
jgi:hypothetical protein